VSIADLVAAPIHAPSPPVAYSTWVWVGGLALIAGILAWYWWVMRHTRPRPAPDLPASHWASVRQEALNKIDSVESEFRNGHLDLRALHLELNTILREYATERLDRDAMWMSASEIAEFDGAKQASELLAAFEEPSFAYDTDAEALAGVHELRGVVQSW